MNSKKVLISVVCSTMIALLPVAAYASQQNKDMNGMENVKLPQTMNATSSTVDPDAFGFGSIVFVCFDGGDSNLLCEFQINADKTSGPITYLNAKISFSDGYNQYFKYSVPNLMSTANQGEDPYLTPGTYSGELSGTVTTLYAFNTIVPVRSSAFVR